MSFKLNPVRKIPQAEIAQIGNPFIGVLCMLKRNMIMVDEDPDELQDGNAKRVATQALLMEAQLRLANEREISFDDAGALFFNRNAKEGEAVEQIDLFAYFTLEEKKEWLQLQQDAKQTRLIAATLMMQTRFVWSFETSKRINPGSETIEIEPVDFPIAKGDRLKFDDAAYPEMQTAEEVIPGQTTIKLASPVRYGVEAHQMGYLLDFKTGKPKTGVPDWTIEDTKHFFSQDMLNAIFDFYQDERSAPAKLIEQVAKESEGNATLATSLPLLDASQPNPLSTGGNSENASNHTESGTNNSASKDLVIALPG